MAKGSKSHEAGKSELNTYKLVGQLINNNYQLRVTNEKHYAALADKVARDIANTSAKQLIAGYDSAHKQNLVNIENSYQAEVARIQSLGLSKQRTNTELAKAELVRIAQVEDERRRMQAERAAFENQIAAEAQAAAEQQYRSANIYKRREIQEAGAAQARLHRQALVQQQYQTDARIAELEAEASKYAANSRIRKQYEAEIKKIRDEQVQLTSDAAAVRAAEVAAYKEEERLTQTILAAREKAAKTNDNQAGAAQLLQNIESQATKVRQKIEQLRVEMRVNAELGIDTTGMREEIEHLSRTVENLDTTAGNMYKAAASDAANKAHAEKKVQIDKVKAQSRSDMAEAIGDQRDLQKAQNTKQAQAEWTYFMSPKGMADNLGKAVANAVENVAAAVSQAINQIDDNINQFYQYQSSVEARLQGSDESYKKSLENISKNVGLSGLVSQKDVIENLKKLSEAGIAYNLDLRAFLATIKDDIAETFDIFDSNLMRLIRLQQSDTTTARLGMEASLTRLFNEFFSDTSYLTDAADTVSQAIIDANSQLTRNMSVEFEYMVQKWLGSLYSLGMDSGTISTIAQGLNYLGTGNVEALNGNESLQNLLAMSASRAGISYADVLTGGLDAETTNSLLKSMVEYLQEIAANSDNNQVTRSAYSNVFGFSIADLTAVSSLSQADVSNIYKQSLDYQGAMDEYSYQASQIFNRTHFSQMLNTVFDNAMMSASTAIGNSAGWYATWKVLNVIEDLTGGIAIPGISVMGNMVDLHQTVTGLAKTGIAGLNLMGSLLGSLFNGSLLGTMDYNKWGYDEFTSRGSATKGISRGTATGTSESSSMSMVGSSSASDIKSTSMSDATDSAEEDSKVTNKNVEDNADIYTQIYEAIANDDTTILQEVLNLQTIITDQSLAVLAAIGTTNELLRESRRFKAEMSGMDSMLSLMDPNRIFYSMIVGMLPLAATDMTINETKVLSVTETAIANALASTTASVTKQTSSAVQEIKSLATQIQDNNYVVPDVSVQVPQSPAPEVTVVTPPSDTGAVQELKNTTSAIQESMQNIPAPVVEVTNQVPPAPTNPVVPTDNSTADEIRSSTTQIQESIYNMSKQSSEDPATSAITKLESAITSVDVQNIANLMAQTSVGMHESTDKTTNQLITNDGLKVSINQMSPEISAFIAATVKSMVSSVITGGTVTSDGEDTVPLIDLLTQALQNNTLNVNVTNDNFDTALQKSAFTN